MNNIIVNFENTVATVTLNRPEVHNAFNAEMIGELTATFKDISSYESISTVILKANGKNFCAGGDLNWMKEAANYDHAKNVADAECLADMLLALYSIPQTTICCTHGAVYGGGVGIVSACDIAIGLNSTKFCLSEVKLGLIPAVISPYVIEATSPRMAKRLFTTAEICSADVANRIGLLQNVYVDNNDLQASLDGILENLSNNAPLAKMAAKLLVETFKNKQIGLKTASQSARIIADTREGDEAKEGITAFLEKRDPSWRKE
jgi:methylglutaconyl-CoA hydratase